MDFVTKLIDSMKATVSRRIQSRYVIAIVGELFSRREVRRFADNLVALDDDVTSVAVKYDPFPAKQGDGAIRPIFDRDKVNESMRLVGWQAGASVVIAQFVESCREAGEFA